MKKDELIIFEDGEMELKVSFDLLKRIIYIILLVKIKGGYYNGIYF
ncbi:MAG: hypothetical protein ACK5L6_10310 [Anaerorhabdus sp.]